MDYERTKKGSFMYARMALRDCGLLKYWLIPGMKP